MSQFNLLRLVGRCGGAQVIANLSDAKTAADRLRAKEVAGEWTAVSRLIDEAASGYVSPQMAFNAFAKLAFAKGIAAETDKSAAWEEFARGAGLSQKPHRPVNRGETMHGARDGY